MLLMMMLNRNFVFCFAGALLCGVSLCVAQTAPAGELLATQNNIARVALGQGSVLTLKSNTRIEITRAAPDLPVLSSKLMAGSACYSSGPAAKSFTAQSPNSLVRLENASALLTYENALTVVYVGSGSAVLTGLHGLRQSVTVGSNEVGTIDADGAARVARFYGPACSRALSGEKIVGGAGLAGNAALIAYVLLQSPASPIK